MKTKKLQEKHINKMVVPKIFMIRSSKIKLTIKLILNQGAGMTTEEYKSGIC